MKTTLLTTAALGLCLIAAGPVSAQSASAQYKSYHLAIEAAKQCRNLPADQATSDRLAGAIAGKMTGEIGPGDRLKLITEAGDEIRAAGCSSPLATESLERFDRELAGSL